MTNHSGGARPCPLRDSCHFPRLVEPTSGDLVLRAVYCGGVWTQCSIYALRAHGHEASPCLWPDGEVKAVQLPA